MCGPLNDVHLFTMMQIRNMILKVDGKTTSVLVDMTKCQKMYSRHAECLPCVGDVLDIVAKCLTLLNENIEQMDSPNDMLPADLR